MTFENAEFPAAICDVALLSKVTVPPLPVKIPLLSQLPPTVSAALALPIKVPVVSIVTLLFYQVLSVIPIKELAL